MDLASHTMRTVRLGAKNLLLHKARSVLTMLGIVFGVCSVVAMLAIGEGASYEAQEAIRLIKIYLSDQMANAVGRSKIAKRKIEAAVLEGIL